MKISPLLALAFLSANAFADTRPEFRQTTAVALNEPPHDVITMDVEQTFQSDFKSGLGRSAGDDRNNNNTNTWHYEIAYAHRFPVKDQWYLRVGFNLNRFDFGDNRSFAPNTLQSYAAVIALEFFVGGDVGFFIETQPGFYFSHDLNADSFDAPTNIVAAYPLVENKLYLVGGVSLSLLRSYPVIPVGGVIWHINDLWDLRACVPDPRIVYKYSKALELWAGGEIVGGGYRVDSSDQPGLSGTTVTYDELRVGGGFTFSGWKPLTIDFGAGWAYQRKFDFNRADQSAETEGAPYVRLTASAQF